MKEPKPPSWQPTLWELTKWRGTTYAKAAVLVGIFALGAVLYLAVVTVLFHHWR